ncbi:MAG TPA: hypothetical protein PLH80_06980 [Spirochaetota bacterium]|nr:hypothetical protein [Spirochaetota bacterium]HOR93799.1 hypothetical protein [Spirochaetota bacterium]HOT18962.1 hypothetical protein [Spirochaetota bacterium]HPK45350.1 hypothetical protein [Spirochaetota bacterium]HQG43878.1 hypothetical protein [Spirochaetota bacterium]
MTFQKNSGLCYCIKYIGNYPIDVNNRIMPMNDTLFNTYYQKRYMVLAAIMLDSKTFLIPINVTKGLTYL